jgi:signal transduction histidine kinase
VAASVGLPDGGTPPGLGHAAETLEGGEPRIADAQLACLPLVLGRGQAPLGALVLWRDDPEDGFSEDEVQRLTGLVDQAAVALSNAELLSELRREQAERQALASALVDAQEEERRRIAEDIHDGPIQELVGLGLVLDAVRSDLTRSGAEGAAEEVAGAGRAVRASVSALREAVFDLHPMALEELGIAAAIRSAVRRLEARGASVEVDVVAADRLPPLYRTVAFRILQEALANVGRHAGASEVVVLAERVDEGVELRVTDDGRGFDAEGDRLAEGHLGLPAMRKRAKLAGGRLTIASAPGAGTTVTLWLPLEPTAPSG